ncbi:MAG: hypothetical protein NT080_10310 [Spirochaetes bacterium]|nr:hypothetical protein [Spirochaetota bacterium]
MEEPKLAELMEDIAAIKRAIRRGNPLLRELAAPDYLLWLSLAGAIGFSFFAVPAPFLWLVVLYIGLLAVFALSGLAFHAGKRCREREAGQAVPAPGTDDRP